MIQNRNEIEETNLLPASEYVFRKVLVMNCIDFCVIFKYRVKQLTIFEHTVVAASDLKNCTMVNCD